MDSATCEEAARHFDIIQQEHHRKLVAQDAQHLISFGADLFGFAARYGFITATLQRETNQAQVVFTLPCNEERRIRYMCGWFRSLLAHFAIRVSSLRGEEEFQYPPPPPKFTDEEISNEYERLGLGPILPGDVEYDIRARRKRVLKSLLESPSGHEREKVWEQEYFAQRVSFWGFAVTIDYPIGEGQTVPLYIETWNNVPGQKAFEFTIRRLAPDEERPIDRPNLHDWMAAQSQEGTV
jgi:hypothetical protein